MRRQSLVTVFVVLVLLTTILSGCLGDDNNEESLGTLVIALEIKDTSEEIDNNPQILADYLSDKLNYDVSIFSVDSEGSMVEALRFGNADIALMDAGAAWVGWQQYDLGVLAADLNVDGRTYYNANALVRSDSDAAKAYLDDDPYSDPFALLSGQTACHTGWLKSVGMLLPMGFLIGHGYANVIGDPNDVETIRATIHGFFDSNSSIPDVGTPYYGYSGALQCLSDGFGDVAFVEENSVEIFCNNIASSDNEDWCLDIEDYIVLPAFGQSPSHPVVYNPSAMDPVLVDDITEVLVGMNSDSSATTILQNILNTPGFAATNASIHLGSYSSLISNIPGISAYYDDQYNLATNISSNLDRIRIAYDITTLSDEVDKDPQILANFLSEKLGVEVSIHNVNSQAEIISALTLGHAEIAFVEPHIAWAGWKQQDLAVMAAVETEDSRTYSHILAWVDSNSSMALAHLDDDLSTDPFVLLEGKTSCHTGWLSTESMLLPIGYLMEHEYIQFNSDSNSIESLRDIIYTFFSSNSSIPESNNLYFGDSGALQCLSDGFGDVVFLQEETLESYCNNNLDTDNEVWCLEFDEYFSLTPLAPIPTNSIIYNPDLLDIQTRTAILNSLIFLNYEMYLENYSTQGSVYTGCYDISIHVIDESSPRNTCGSEIMNNILGTSGMVRVTSQEHLGTYSAYITNIPGISSYYSDMFGIS
jgi:ABC-type phosphate/phosphonate transport system substrate-binding protein